MAHRTLNTREVRPVKTGSEEIARKLTRRIFLGEFPKDAKLPPERELAAEYGVARTVLREAVKRLEAVGIVRSWRGSGVYVQDLEFMRGVELFDTLITLEDGSLNIPFLREVLEFRGHFIRLVVRLAAVHRTEEDITGIKQLIGEWERADDDPKRFADLTLELIRQVVGATHNRVCIGLCTTLERIAVRILSLVDLVMPDSSQKKKIFHRILEALQDQDPVMAELAAIRYLEKLETTLSSGAAAHNLVHVAQ
jgi:DNA-binding FadR family transcriptional regulator